MVGREVIGGKVELSEAQVDTIFAAYLGVGVLRTMCRRAGLKLGEDKAEEIESGLARIFPEFPAMSAVRK